MLKRKLLTALCATSLTFVGAGCGDDEPNPPNPPAQTYSVGGTVSGLEGSGLVLTTGTNNVVTVSASGAFTFPTELSTGTAYAVTVQTQPSNPSQTCAVTNGSGTVGSVDVTNVQVACTTNSFTVGGTVTGLTGTGLTLRNNGGDNLAVTANGAFTFATRVESGEAFAVTIATQPSGPTQTCTVSGGTGTVGSGNVTTVTVNCATNTFTVGGTVSGLVGEVTLALAAGGAPITAVVTAEGTFAFGTAVASGTAYTVTVQTQPANQTCTVANGTGEVGSANVTDVAVTCVTTPPNAECADNSACAINETCNTTSFQCEAIAGLDPVATSAEITAFKDAAVGTLATPLPVTNAYVTYVKPTTGTETAGFFVQAEANGPALFVSEAGATANVGDLVSFSILAKSTNGVSIASDVDALTTHSSLHPVQNLSTAAENPGLSVDRSGEDVVAALDALESTLLKLTGTTAGASASAGSGHKTYTFNTAGYPAGTGLRLRMPIVLADQLAMVAGCTFTVDANPMWRFTATAQPSVYDYADFSAISCADVTPSVAPKLVSATATSLTQVKLTFDRSIKPASITAAATQFTFDNGLTATAAAPGTEITAISPGSREIVVTTSTQTAGTVYTATVANSVVDVTNVAVTAPAAPVTFTGFRVPAVLVLNEVNPNISAGADLVEFKVVSAGTTAGITLTQDGNATVFATLPDVQVAANDLIVLHLFPTAAQIAAGNETTSKDQVPQATVASYYDTAWDFIGPVLTSGSALTNGNRIWRVKGPAGNTQDAVAFVNTINSPAAAYVTQLQAVQAEGFWKPVDCRGAGADPVLCTYTSAPETAISVSVDLAGIDGTTATSVSRTVVDADPTNNQKSDWAAAGVSSYGVDNP